MDTPGRVLLRNTIVAGNTSVSVGPDVKGTVFSFGYNLIGVRDGSSGWASTDRTGTAANPIDPRLGPLQDNGGPTPTHAVLAGSPAVGAGDGDLAYSLDQRGTHRSAGPPTVGAVAATRATHFLVVGPEQVTAGEPFTFTVVAVDFANFVATTYAGPVHFSSTDFDAQLPDDTSFSADDGGMHAFTATLFALGQQSILVNDVAHPNITGSVSFTVVGGQPVVMSPERMDGAFSPLDAIGRFGSDPGVFPETNTTQDGIGTPARLADGISAQRLPTDLLESGAFPKRSPA
jgi:hypothetical protein